MERRSQPTGTLNLKNAEFALDKRPIEENCACPACREFSRGYIRHLIKAEEILGLRLITLHNLHFYLNLMSQARTEIENGTFDQFRKAFVAEYKTRDTADRLIKRLTNRHSERSRGIPWQSCQVTSRDVSTSLDMTEPLFFASCAYCSAKIRQRNACIRVRAIPRPVGEEATTDEQSRAPLARASRTTPCRARA